ncbi:hypothetical protein CXG50_06365 [Pseudomonas plecoglossicida]|uniref:hypothetical protein n=1 Tax=Pseudomonas TaxID=286 RepID=UPI0002A16BB2|nr:MULTISPECIES: hypothetical protein [Pseudomonas]AGA72662.1 hypothetical protein B479_08770 [Pseudomonas putida HB3267]MCE0757346.1 hypothetical protein [Pseudomonas asiatica]MCE0946418.1 hypothetical protein [Pseudomonas asiatica]MCE0957445.1 hypothetical protein [Pseudomonas asiatica]MCE1032883.1 hypothetical protein [Pseudomonas asiatica]
MINLITSDEKCFPITFGTLEENDIKIEFGSSLTDQTGDIDTEKVAILKPDQYYNTIDFATPPKSVDGIVLVKDSDKYHLYIAELKSAKKIQSVKQNDVNEKFTTIFKNFFEEDFKHIFVDQDYQLKSLSLWLICDPVNIRSGRNDPAVYERKLKALKSMKGVLADYSLALKTFSFKGFTTPIKLMISPPTIEQDSFIEYAAEALA